MEPIIYKPSIYNGAGVYNTSGVYKGAGIYKGGEGGVKYVNIGGRDYRIIKIGNLVWLAENLAADTPNSYWYNNTPNQNGKLYNWSAISSIEALLSDGWRLPTNSDAIYLIQNNAYLDLLSKGNGGTNASGFDFVFAGYRFANGLYYDDGQEGDFLLKASGYRVRFRHGVEIKGYDYNDNYAFSVRLVKDAE